MSDPTLGVLVRMVRYRAVRGELCCPHCGGDIELRAGQLLCVKSEREGLPAPAFRSLAELAVRNAR